MVELFEGKIVHGDVDINYWVRELTRSSLKGAGALVIFVGFVKGIVDGHKVCKLIYEAYEPYASKRLREIAESYRGVDGVYDVVILHRIGELDPGDTTVYIFVTARTRELAFKVAREVLERVKHESLIFKLERRDDGEYWIIGDGRRIKRK